MKVTRPLQQLLSWSRRKRRRVRRTRRPKLVWRVGPSLEMGCVEICSGSLGWLSPSMGKELPRWYQLCYSSWRSCGLGVACDWVPLVLPHVPELLLPSLWNGQIEVLGIYHLYLQLYWWWVERMCRMVIWMFLLPKVDHEGVTERFAELCVTCSI